jgi:transcriptional antiterminator NusG
MAADFKWYILNILSGSEHKVVKAINDAAIAKGVSDEIEQIIIPSENIQEMRKGKKVVAEKKVFPGYIMIKMRLGDVVWNLVKNTPKVIGFLGSGNRPHPVSETEVARVLKRVEEGAVAKEIELTFDVGESVKIMDGAFESFVGTVDSIDVEHKILKVSVSIFGRSTPVELEYHQVEKVQ